LERSSYTWTEESHRIFSQNIWCSSKYLNQAPPKYKCRAILLEQPAWC
jgi:hypothetical protein